MKYFRLLVGMGWILAGICLSTKCDLNQPSDSAVNSASELIADSKIVPNDSQPSMNSQAATAVDDTKSAEAAAYEKDKITDGAVLDNSDLSNPRE